MKTLASFSALALAFALTAGTVSAQQPTAASKPAAREQVITQVRVTNHNWLDAKVYLADGGVLTRLGTVLTGQTALLTIPSHVLSSASRLRIVAMPIGSTSAYVSPDLMMVKGDQVLVTLENQLGLSSTSMRATAD